MHKEILTKGQEKLFPLLKRIGKEYGLVGGTAVALHIGHRRSIDFDLFSPKSFRAVFLKKKIQGATSMDQVLVDKCGEFTFFAQGVKITFFHFPYAIDYKETLDGIIKMPTLLTLAAMKAFALGRRAKWKDYVDLYFIIRDYHPLAEIIKKGEEMFGDEFNAKIFRTQLAYFDDVSYEEKVEFLPGFAVSDKKIKEKLVQYSLE